MPVSVKAIKFTFHYGQIFNIMPLVLNQISRFIYIPLWLDFQLNSLKYRQYRIRHLHSTMVRFSIAAVGVSIKAVSIFTFHYGQIFNIYQYFIVFVIFVIYIPLWLDFQFRRIERNTRAKCIYIPLWLDFQWEIEQRIKQGQFDLHSTMVRFSIHD